MIQWIQGAFNYPDPNINALSLLYILGVGSLCGDGYVILSADMYKKPWKIGISRRARIERGGK